MGKNLCFRLGVPGKDSYCACEICIHNSSKKLLLQRVFVYESYFHHGFENHRDLCFRDPNFHHEKNFETNYQDSDNSHEWKREPDHHD
ncbi:hypothetical protein ACOMHN_038344 [Nucella lapillus]